MSGGFDKRPGGGSLVGEAVQREASGVAPAPGKQTLTEGAGGAEGVHAAAAQGTSGPATALPFSSQIQKAFGPHDIGGIRAHTDGAAAEGASAMGAKAFASGDHVAFGGSPDLHTAAHEAAHVVQQRGDVQLKGGVGQAGDAHEQNADAVADRVVQGKSAVDLLPAVVGAGGGSGLGPVQKTDGTITHQHAAGAGQVTARENDKNPNDGKNTTFSLEYAGKDADKAHWLQFVYFKMYADTPTGKVYYTGSVGTSSGTKPFSTDKVTNWSVDSASASDPYYEAGFLNSRDPGKNTKIFDQPGGASIAPFAGQLVTTKAPTATKVTFIAGFQTYLVADGKSIYHVDWTATTEYDPAKKTAGAVAYGTGAAGDVAALPKNLKGVLDTQYAGNKIT